MNKAVNSGDYDSEFELIILQGKANRNSSINGSYLLWLLDYSLFKVNHKTNWY